MTPKKVYRDKVRQRLSEMQKLLLGDPERLRIIIHLALFADQEKLQRMMGRVKVPREPGSPTDGQAAHNGAEHLRMLLEQDLPAILDALEEK